LIITNFKKFLDYLNNEYLRAVGVGTDKNDRILLCALENDVVGNMDFFLFMIKESPTLK
jgi:hypothetical protein